MSRVSAQGRAVSTAGKLLATALVCLLALPPLALLLSADPDQVQRACSHPLFTNALGLSLRTTLYSLGIVIASGTPLAYWLSSRTGRFVRAVELLVSLPIIIPPAVVGIALLRALGRRGILAPALDLFELSLPFSSKAVVIAQVIVSAPFFVHASTTAFRKVDRDMLLVARTLGASHAGAFFRVAVPIALPGLLIGATLSWARALGEFGATLLFAGNMSARTQTMPLAIYTALESDINLAVALSLLLTGVGAIALLCMRYLPHALALLARRRPSQ